MKSQNSISLLLFILLLSLVACATSETISPAALVSTATQPLPTQTFPILNDAQGFLSAVQMGDPDRVSEYIDQGYAVNWTDMGGLSLLNYAANQGSTEVISMLLAQGAEVNYQDPWGMSSLHAALKEGHDEAAILLIENGADVNLSTTAGYYPGYSALHVAVKFGKVTIATIEYLLEHGADVTLRTEKGTTALMFARESAWQEAENLLIVYGATE